MAYSHPLLVLDEAHHLKNPATRLSSLFVEADAERVEAVSGVGFRGAPSQPQERAVDVYEHEPVRFEDRGEPEHATVEALRAVQVRYAQGQVSDATGFDRHRGLLLARLRNGRTTMNALPMTFYWK